MLAENVLRIRCSVCQSDRWEHAGIATPDLKTWVCELCDLRRQNKELRQRIETLERAAMSRPPAMR